MRVWGGGRGGVRGGGKGGVGRRERGGGYRCGEEGEGVRVQWECDGVGR